MKLTIIPFALFLARVSAECNFSGGFGACLNWCYDTNPGAERYIIEGCYRAVCSDCRPN
ncbi:hypothetical protein CGMCC3_g11699 [Colletotrichum fructicola]|nr:uncharacterized protein CGMCC3_g11699 [Colletotrichum fructicola]KAE9572307.1 hypothetical protein CGMCC3_g11699 [Colletotrichum fructicola]